VDLRFQKKEVGAGMTAAGTRPAGQASRLPYFRLSAATGRASGSSGASGRAPVLRPHLAQRARIIGALKSGDLLGAGLNATVRPRGAPGLGGSGSSGDAGSGRLSSPRGRELVAVNRALRRGKRAPLTGGFAAVPGVVLAAVNISVG
jgi:hypothetical protein